MAEEGRAADIERYRAHLQDEVDGAALYHAIAAAEKDPRRAAVLRRLAETEARHAEHWRQKLEQAGAPVAALPRPSMSPRLLGFLARRLGTRAVLPVAQAMELRGGNVYAGEPGAEALAADERAHARTVRGLAANREAAAGGLSRVLDRERWHKGRAGGGNLRAAIFGVNDGLVSNLSLVMGVAGANPGGRFLLLSGIAGLLAGAFSMAAGEYVSVSAQRELFERQIALEREELVADPAGEREELSLIYQAKGVPAEEADQLAARLLENPDTALDTMAREELGLNPDDLGNPWSAALSSFIMFAFGAIMPVLPFLFGGGALAIAVSAVVGSLMLFTVGAALSLFTGRNPLYSGARMLGIGAAAAAITFLVGRLIGVSVT